ncbi:hypothetical protein ACVI1J_001499 [Bradyrhizobium diazoefficiens]
MRPDGRPIEQHERCAIVNREPAKSFAPGSMCSRVAVQIALNNPKMIHTLAELVPVLHCQRLQADVKLAMQHLMFEGLRSGRLRLRRPRAGWRRSPRSAVAIGGRQHEPAVRAPTGRDYRDAVRGRRGWSRPISDACRMGLKGLIAKHRDRAYRGGRQIKGKNRSHPAMERELRNRSYFGTRGLTPRCRLWLSGKCEGA